MTDKLNFMYKILAYPFNVLRFMKNYLSALYLLIYFTSHWIWYSKLAVTKYDFETFHTGKCSIHKNAICCVVCLKI